MKKIITLALAIVLCFSLTVSAFAAEYTVDLGAQGRAVFSGHTATIEQENPLHDCIYQVEIGSTVTVTMDGAEKLRLCSTYKDDSGIYWNHPMCTSLEYDTLTITLDQPGVWELQVMQQMTFDNGFTMDTSIASVMVCVGEMPKDATAADFTDVSAEAFYAEAFYWAVDAKVTYGTTPSTFSPDDICTRAHAVSFLFRATGGYAMGYMPPYADVMDSDYFCNPVIWAYEWGLLKGTGDTTFSPHNAINCADLVNMLWKLNGSVQSEGEDPAMSWAQANGLFDGLGELTGTSTLTRGQALTLIYRAVA